MSLPSRDLQELTDDAERLAYQLSRSASKDEALEIAIKAAEISMQALKLARDPDERVALSTKARLLLQEAEDIKLAHDWRSVVQGSQAPDLNVGKTSVPSRPSKPLQEPRTTRKLPKKEEIILLKAGYLNNFKFPPWKAPPDPSEFDLADDGQLFTDSQDLPLSEFQEDVLDDWKRPTDALPPPSWFPGDRTNLGPSMSFSRKIDLVQDAATDCSVVASLCAGVARAERGHQKILRAVLHPYDAQSGRPLISQNGKYVARLNFNGCFRRVVVDDRLPTSSTNRVIHVVDRNNPGLLWPALVEKAYLKVRGGYDFPGSNSGTDIWILTGWIPEQVFLQSDDLEPDRFWKRISNAHSHGDVLITLGTGKMSPKTERELGLAGEHDYAMLDLKELDGQKLMLIKNPWCDSTTWKGKQTNLDRSDTSGSDTVVGNPLIDFAEDDKPVQNPRDLLNSDDKLSPGTFWMDLDNVMQYFESIYLNWNPGLFAFRQDLHFEWDLSPAECGGGKHRGQYASLSRNPQYTVTTDKGGIIYVLLWRHFKNAVPADATAEEIEANRYGIELSGHMSLLAFSSRGRRELLPDRAIEKGWFVDSPQTLLKLEECRPGEIFTLVPVEQELPATNLSFTVSVFCNSSVTLAEASNRYPYSRTLSGSWTTDTAGGNAHSPTYSTNPQFAITVTFKTSISLLLEASHDQLNVNLKLVHSKGLRIYSIRKKDIVFDSGDYRRGCCLAEFAELDPGHYTIICSTFEPHQLGDFSLLVESSQPTIVKMLPREGAGRVRMELSAVTFKQGDSKIAAQFIPNRLVKFYAVARLLDQKSPSMSRSLVRLSIELGREPNRRMLVASNGGDYSDSAGGIRTEDIDLDSTMRSYGEMSIVMDRMYASAGESEERFSVELYMDQPNAVTCGVWRTVDD